MPDRYRSGEPRLAPFLLPRVRAHVLERLVMSVSGDQLATSMTARQFFSS